MSFGATAALGLPGFLGSKLGGDAFTDFLFGTNARNEEVSRLTGGQQDLLNFIIQQAMGGGQFDEESFQKSFVDPALKQFESRTAPSIQQKFISAGAGQSSSLEDALTRAGADVQGGLDQKRAELLNQALNRQLQAAGLGLGTQAFDIEQIPEEEGALGSILSALGAAAGGAFGGPGGAKIGAGVGQAAGGLGRGFRR